MEAKVKYPITTTYFLMIEHEIENQESYVRASDLGTTIRNLEKKALMLDWIFDNEFNVACAIVNGDNEGNYTMSLYSEEKHPTLESFITARLNETPKDE